jgi:transcriptional regulator with XRE-family HTH domain
MKTLHDPNNTSINSKNNITNPAIPISIKLYSLRKTLKLTIVDIQHITGINKAQYFKYENGTNIPFPKTLHQFLSKLEIDYHSFLKSDNPEHYVNANIIKLNYNKRYFRRYKNKEAQYDYASRLIELRTYLKYTLREFSVFVNINFVQYSRYERNINLPRTSMINKILQKTTFSIDDFFSNTPFHEIKKEV